MGDVLSPSITLYLFLYIFYKFIIKAKDRKRWYLFSWCISLAVFFWFLCDFWWAIQTIILHTDPEKNFITLYGYSITNVLLFMAMIFSGYHNIKIMNKIQALLDMMIVFVCFGVLLWLFVFDQKIENITLLISDPISLASVLIDAIIYFWINIWAFSTRGINPPVFHRLIVLAGLVFVVTDMAYYYIYFYKDYLPNTWLDGFYIISFSLVAIAANFRDSLSVISLPKDKKLKNKYKIGFEIVILIIPIIVFVFKRDQLQYVILLVVALLIYFVLLNYTQKNIFREKLLEMEKLNVIELEKKVEERTEEIVRILNRDFVTGLLSRRYFESKLSELINNVEKNEKIAVLYIDQNKSKAIKYLYGKETAENLIRELGKEIDRISKDLGGFAAAYGDDIFVAVFIGIDGDKYGNRTAKEIVNRCNSLFQVDNHEIRVTVNIGISCYPTDTKDSGDLIKNADIAMIQARAVGFNKIQIYNDKIGNLTYNKHRLELKLKKVEFDKEFCLYFQPQIAAETLEICGIESLIRWEESEGVFISPMDFIPVAEETGLIVPLGYWVIEMAARQYATWKIISKKRLRISVNVSYKQLIETNFVRTVFEIISRYKILPGEFEIEITESQEIEESINVIERLNELEKHGISIAIDDFGTGYSSINYLKKVPVNRIKIAKELIDRIENDAYSESIIKMVISSAKVKGIKVIAEGVETKEQFECLKKFGCDEIQGYFFAKPMPPGDLNEKWL